MMDVIDRVFLLFGQQVAVIAGNLELAEMIQNYKPEDIGKTIVISLTGHPVIERESRKKMTSMGQLFIG